jgi:hypothetical protein
MTTTQTLDRIDMVKGSTAYESKIGKQPRHLSEELGDSYKVNRKAPKHRKDDPRPKHRLWDIEQH